jgi:hypothetical protein
LKRAAFWAALDLRPSTFAARPSTFAARSSKMTSPCLLLKKVLPFRGGGAYSVKRPSRP